MLKEIKPKTARSARALAKRGSLINENPKKVLFLRSTSSSSLLNSLAADLYSIKRPLAVRFNKKNAVHPFEDPSSLEFFSQKNDTSLLCFSSHKCTIMSDSARPMAQFGGPKCQVGTKPLLSFSGNHFDEPGGGAAIGNKFAIAKSIFIDFFKGEDTREVDVEGLQMMMSFAATEQEREGHLIQIIHMRVWKISTRRSGQRLPIVGVEEIGPRIDFVLGRVREAEGSVLKEALKRSKAVEAKTKKNVETDIMGDKIGRIHLGRQDLEDLQTRKMKGLKRNRVVSASLQSEDGESEEEEISREGEDRLKGTSGSVDVKRQRTL